MEKREKKTAQSLTYYQRIATERTKRSRDVERALTDATKAKAKAEARLAAAEGELAALKTAHDDLTHRARLATYMRAAPSLRLSASPTPLMLPPSSAADGVVRFASETNLTLTPHGTAPSAPRPMMTWQVRFASETDVTDREWAPLLSLAASANVHRAVAAALHQGMNMSHATLDGRSYLASLQSREDVANVLCSPALADTLVSLVWESLQEGARRGR